MEELKTSFLKTYANTPVSLRGEVVLVLEKTGPITWYAAYIEVTQDTLLSKEILQGLHDLKLI